ncbi:MAG: DUF4345 domain-containing protein [Cyanobacteria bacterium P01_A01_bin.123]
MNRLTSFFLVFAALLLLAIGSTILLVPHAFYASDGIMLGNDPSLLSEIRAPGGLLASSGLLIFLGAFRAHLRSLSITLSVLVYGAFGLSRLVGFTLDGSPSNNLVMATGVELTVAAIGLVILCRQPGADSTVSAYKLRKQI